MTGQELFDLIKKGIKPVIKFNKEIEDLDLQFDEGHFARIIDVKLLDDEVEIIVSEKEYADYNKENEVPNWPSDNSVTGNVEYNLKYSDKHTRKEVISLYQMLTDEIYNFAIVESCYQELLDEYLSTNRELSYVEWLQEKVLELRAFVGK